MKVEIKREKSVLNLKNDLDAKGVHMENVYVDGKLVGVIGVASEEDKKRAEETLARALEESNGDVMKALMMLSQLADLSEKEVSPDEEVEVKGRKYFISYKECKLYDAKGNVITDCDDLDAAAKKSMTKDVVKALLTSRVK